MSKLKLTPISFDIVNEDDPDRPHCNITRVGGGKWQVNPKFPDDYNKSMFYTQEEALEAVEQWIAQGKPKVKGVFKHNVRRAS